MTRRALVVVAVVGLHVGGLWALQRGLLQRAIAQVVPVQVLAELLEPPKPLPPRPPAEVKRPPPQPSAAPRPKTPTPPPAPQPLAVAAPAPDPQAPNGVLEAHPSSASAAVAVAPVAAPAPPVPVHLPSSSADYLNNDPPIYPAMSRRLGEQGTVIVRAFIGTDGRAGKAELHRSSGYERLDQVAIQTVLRWRYVAGTRGGVPEAMWFNVPIRFVLE